MSNGQTLLDYMRSLEGEATTHEEFVKLRLSVEHSLTKIFIDYDPKQFDDDFLLQAKAVYSSLSLAWKMAFTLAFVSLKRKFDDRFYTMVMKHEFLETLREMFHGGKPPVWLTGIPMTRREALEFIPAVVQQLKALDVASLSSVALPVIPTGSRTCLVVRIADASDFERVPKEIVRDNKVVDLYVIVGSPVTRIGERLSMKNLSALGIVNHVLN